MTQIDSGKFSVSVGVPNSDAFYLPADVCRHTRLWLPWPRENSSLQAAVTSVIRAAAEFEPVSILAAPGSAADVAAACGRDAREIVSLVHLSPRLRDTGPTFLVDGKGGSAAVDWRFNGWGGRGDPSDASLAHALLGAAEVRRFRAPLTLEGSNFVGDGRGTLLALASAVFDKGSNPALTQIEALGFFQGWLGTEQVIWLPGSHPGDRLNTGISTLATFIAPGRVAITHPGDNALLAQISERLQHAQDWSGKTLELIRFPAPTKGRGTLRHFLSYTNYLPVNGGLLVPAFDTPSDARAADILAEAFPDRVIQPVPATILAEAGITLTSLGLPHPARLLERDRATVFPRAAWGNPTPGAEGLLQHMPTSPNVH